MFKTLGLKYRTRKASKKRQEPSQGPISKNKKVGIITSNEIYKSPDFKSFVSTLATKGMDTDILVFNDEKKVIDKLTPHYTKNDYTWTGKIKSPFVNKFVKTPFDFLFSVNTSSILHIENILALSKAKCRVGTTTLEANDHLDFIIKVKENNSINKLTNSMLNYTEIQY